MSKVLSVDDLGEELCNHCDRTDYGSSKVNTAPWNLCEGGACDIAYDNYLDEMEGEE